MYETDDGGSGQLRTRTRTGGIGGGGGGARGGFVITPLKRRAFQ